jgi:hypothetical protein
MKWAAALEPLYPALRLLYAIPNGGARHKAVAGKMRAEGVKKGVPDLHLPVARQGFHSLFIEMKREFGGKVSDEQRAWLAALTEEGHRVERCNGAGAACAVLLDYLGLTGRVTSL